MKEKIKYKIICFLNRYYYMYFLCQDWLGKQWIIRINPFQGLLLIFLKSDCLVQAEYIPKKDIDFYDSREE